MPSLEGSTSTAAWLSNLALDDLKRIANHLLEVIDPDGAEEHMGKQLDAEEQKAHDKTELTMSSAGNGMTRGRFLLPNVQAGIFRTALEGKASPCRNARISTTATTHRPPAEAHAPQPIQSRTVGRMVARSDQLTFDRLG
ncbi:MAG: hypothetical protein ACXWXV_06035 [Aeromicrobium sp.]